MRGIIIRRTIDDFTTSLVSCQSAVLRIHTVDPDPTLWQNADPKPEQNENSDYDPLIRMRKFISWPIFWLWSRGCGKKIYPNPDLSLIDVARSTSNPVSRAKIIDPQHCFRQIHFTDSHRAAHQLIFEISETLFKCIKISVHYNSTVMTLIPHGFQLHICNITHV